MLYYRCSELRHTYVGQWRGYNSISETNLWKQHSQLYANPTFSFWLAQCMIIVSMSIKIAFISILNVICTLPCASILVTPSKRWSAIFGWNRYYNVICTSGWAYHYCTYIHLNHVMPHFRKLHMWIVFIIEHTHSSNTVRSDHIECVCVCVFRWERFVHSKTECTFLLSVVVTVKLHTTKRMHHVNTSRV